MPSAPVEPAEVQSIRSMLHWTRIVALIFGIIYFIIFLAGLITIVLILGGVGAFYAIFVIWGILDFLIYYEAGEIRKMLNRGDYAQAKSKTLIWMILGFIIGGIIVGVLLLIAYLKFDPVINWQRGVGTLPPAAQPAYAAPAAAAAAPMAASAAAAPPPPQGAPAICPKCGKPATWIAQYNRWYCYTDAQYV